MPTVRYSTAQIMAPLFPRMGCGCVGDTIYIEIHAPFSTENEEWVRDLLGQAKFEVDDETVRIGWAGGR
jgi:hypothetical protein